MDIEHFSLPLLAWYDKNKRDMIWRDHFDPYYIWLSEIMLQQTRIEAAKEYFIRFTNELPDIASLAQVSEDRLMKLWEGLGYYNRARNLQKAAKILVDHYGGTLPADFDALLSLPGIGPYTAGAIASMAFGIKAPAVDGNVLRVVMRYLACDDDIAKMSVRKKVEQQILSIMPERPGDFNQAIMELGEVVCIPNGAPHCTLCPIQNTCRANKGGCQEQYPKKAEKKTRRIEQRTLLVLEQDGLIGIQKRPPKGLLAGLYEFPAWDGNLTEMDVTKKLEDLGIYPLDIQEIGRATHIFSHVEWHITGFHIVLNRNETRGFLSDTIQFVPTTDLTDKYSMPTAFHFYLKQLLK